MSRTEMESKTHVRPVRVFILMPIQTVDICTKTSRTPVNIGFRQGVVARFCITAEYKIQKSKYFGQICKRNRWTWLGQRGSVADGVFESRFVRSEKREAAKPMSVCRTEARTQYGDKSRVACLQIDGFVSDKQRMNQDGKESGHKS